MAAKTPATIVRESAGSLTLHIADFTTAMDSGDSWASGLPNVVGFYATSTSGTSASIGTGGIGVSNSSGTFTFLFGGGGPMKATLYVLSRT